MGELFTLDADTKSVITQALDDLITELGKNCKLFYPPKMTTCVNCVIDPIGNKSSNIYKHGGPIPFQSATACPMCNGSGKRAEEQYEIIQLSCNWDMKSFSYPVNGLDIRKPYSVVEIKGYLKDVPKLKRAAYLLIELPITPIVSAKFKLESDPIDISNIIQGRYFSCIWKQI